MSARTTVLITGFGPFPGVPVNATMRLLPELAHSAERRYPDVHFAAETLPTEWAAAPRLLDRLLADLEPDFAVHFGVSSRARGFEVERRARNLCSVQPDAAGVLPLSTNLNSGGPEHLAASLPVQHIVTRLRRLGIPAFESRDAGTYLCNATLYHSLACGRATPRRRIGFVHVPASLARPGNPNHGRTGACPLTWAQALGGALEILAVCLSRPPGRLGTTVHADARANPRAREIASGTLSPR